MNHYSELFSKRAGIVRGLVEPEPEDCDWTDGCVSPDDDDEEVKALRDKLSITREVEGGALGVPEFWLTCLKNGELTADMIYSHDEPVLRHLYDIKVSSLAQLPSCQEYLRLGLYYTVTVLCHRPMIYVTV